MVLNHLWPLMSVTPFFRFPNLLVRSTCKRFLRRSFKSELKCEGKRTCEQEKVSKTHKILKKKHKSCKTGVQKTAQLCRYFNIGHLWTILIVRHTSINDTLSYLATVDHIQDCWLITYTLPIGGTVIKETLIILRAKEICHRSNSCYHECHYYSTENY